ncbi:hypothetical protein GXM_10316 [Nostoc sphaeroides CCNUC1]|uniref:Uncharacterized protein n=1 Tax=Nostoc sphaeroides CCNUC1 TaxID=2653204 RepID=A0A5P8WJ05_9NOSO|nr:hypothetical protein GXM_10316 [Nostoc sphaeroides CCNUC1]
MKSSLEERICSNPLHIWTRLKDALRKLIENYKHLVEE